MDEEKDKHSGIFPLMEKMLDHITGFESRFRGIEIKVLVMWWIGATMLVTVVIPVGVHLLQKLLS